MPERQLQNFIGAKRTRRCQLPASCRPKASSVLADRVPLEDDAVARDRFAEKPLLATSKGPRNIARLVNGLVVDARALGSDLPALTSA